MNKWQIINKIFIYLYFDFILTSLDHKQQTSTIFNAVYKLYYSSLQSPKDTFSLADNHSRKSLNTKEGFRVYF